jgi:hypothetical protein
MVQARDFPDLGSRVSTCVAGCETNGVLLERGPDDGTAILQSPCSYPTPVWQYKWKSHRDASSVMFNIASCLRW